MSDSPLFIVPYTRINAEGFIPELRFYTGDIFYNVNTSTHGIWSVNKDGFVYLLVDAAAYRAHPIIQAAYEAYINKLIEKEMFG